VRLSPVWARPNAHYEVDHIKIVAGASWVSP
jgi:hypothetical protein